MKKAILGAWAVGCAVGFASAVLLMASGCVAGIFALTNARADGNTGTTMTVPCSTTVMYNGNQVTFAVQSFPGKSAEDILASTWVIWPPPPYKTALTLDGVAYARPSINPVGAWSNVLFADGSLAVGCPVNPVPTEITLYVR